MTHTERPEKIYLECSHCGRQWLALLTFAGAMLCFTLIILIALTR